MRIDVSKLQELVKNKEFLPPRDSGLTIEEICINVFGNNHNPSPAEREYIGLFVSIVNEGRLIYAPDIISEIAKRGQKLSLNCEMAKLINEQNDFLLAMKIQSEEVKQGKEKTNKLSTLFSPFQPDNLTEDQFVSVYDKQINDKLVTQVIAESRLELDVQNIEYNVTINTYKRLIKEGHIKEPVLFSKYMMNDIYEERADLDISSNYQIKNPRLKNSFHLIEKCLIKFESLSNEGWDFETVYAMFVHYLDQINFDCEGVFKEGLAGDKGDEEEISIEYGYEYNEEMEEDHKSFISDNGFENLNEDCLNSEINFAESQYLKVENFREEEVKTYMESKVQPELTEEKQHDFSIVSEQDLSFISSQSSRISSKRKKWQKKKSDKHDISVKISAKDLKNINMSFNKGKNEIVIKITK